MNATAQTVVVDDDHIDDHVDDEIATCLTLERPTSFFLFAGAGSGKTRSLVEALARFREKSGKRLRLNGQQIGVITYTNNACDEIKQRLDFDPLVSVSTIHSFVWLLISGFHSDIKKWLETTLQSDIAELAEQQRKGKAGTKAAIDRANSIDAKTRRLASLVNIKRFTYNPNGDNRGQDSLNHSEVIKIGSEFLSEKSVMQSLLVNKYPILLIDESQDTNKLLMEAFLKVQTQQREHFALGLLGDTMQRIYADGKADLGRNLPPDWAKPVKQMNHRCPRRIVTLINKIRSAIDNQQQKPRSDKEDGFVRLFILPNTTADKTKAEREAAQRMATVTNDPLWSGANAEVKTLILEHHMAAKRMGFLEMYEPLYKDESLRIGLLDGSLAGIRLFSGLALPLVKAQQGGDAFAVASIVRKHSPLLSKLAFRTENQPLQIQKAREAVDKLCNLWSNSGQPTFLAVFRSIAETGLFEIPESLRPIAARNESEQEAIAKKAVADTPTEEGDADHILNAWDECLSTPFAQIESYVTYISEKASFDTHQGVKGLEFPRVMVIIDDTEARGFAFGYEKLFGAKAKSEADLKNEREGKDTGIDRTRRLLYVTCSRTEKSLAIVAYSENPRKVCEFVTSQGWFDAQEIVVG